MKKVMDNSFARFSLMATLGLLFVFSCAKPEIEPELPDPVFPSQLIEKTILAGEEVEISFETNQAWKVSVTGEGSGNVFWLDQNGMKKTSISSDDAGAQKVKVVFSDIEEFDKKRICEVNLKMAGQEEKIAVITRLPKQRTTEFFIGILGESDFKRVSKSYQFGESPVKEGNLSSFEGSTSYRLPVKVVTNYDWSMALPEWISATILSPESDGEQSVVSGKAGATEILLTAILSSKVSAGVEGSIKVFDNTNTESVEEFKLALPAFDDRMEFTINSVHFNIPGQVLMPNGSYTEDPAPAIAYVLATQEARIIALEYKDTKYEGSAEWLKIESDYNPENGYLQDYPVLFSVEENTGVERVADILVLPSKFKDVKIEDLYDATASQIKKEYSEYNVARITQEGIIPPYITPVSSEELMLEVGTYYTVLDATAEENVMKWDFPGAPSYHRFVYSSPYSHEEASFECFKPFAKCVMYHDEDFPNGLFSKKVEGEGYWLSFAAFAENTKGRFNISSVPEESVQTAAVFYDADDQVLACVLIRYDVTFSGSDDLILTLEAGNAALNRLGEDSEIYQAFASEYTVTDVYELTTSDPALLLTSSEAVASFMINQAMPPFPEYTKAPFNMEVVEQTIMIDNSPLQETLSSVIVLRDENMLNTAAIYYTYNHIPEDTPGEGEEGGDTPGEGEEGGDTPGEGGEEGGDTPGEGEEGGDTPGEGEEGGDTPGEGGEEGGDTPGEGEEGGDTPGEGGEEGPVEVDPAEIFTLEIGAAEMIKLGIESEVLNKVYANHKITQVYQITTMSKMTTLVLDDAYEVYGYLKLDVNTLKESTEEGISMEPMSQNIVMYSNGGSERKEALYILLKQGNEAFAAIHYVYDINADIHMEDPFQFVYPDRVKGAELRRYTGSELEALQEQFYGLESYNVYELIYTTASPTRPYITVPSQPAYGAAWGNESGDKSYWLTYTKVDAKSINVKMTQPGLTDYFVFKTSDGLSFTHVLICTYKPAN